MSTSDFQSSDKPNSKESGPRFNVAPRNLLIGGMLACAVTPFVIRKCFAETQLAQTPIPFLLFLGIPFLLSVVVMLLGPKSGQFAVRWILFGTAAFMVGDLLDIRFRDGNNNLGGIELILLTGLAAVMLAAGTVLGRMCNWIASRFEH